MYFVTIKEIDMYTTSNSAVMNDLKLIIKQRDKEYENAKKLGCLVAVDQSRQALLRAHRALLQMECMRDIISDAEPSPGAW